MDITIKNIETGQDEQYNIEDLLGFGATGSVSKVTHTTTRKEYALKEVYLSSKEITIFLKQELKNLKRLGLLRGFKIGVDRDGNKYCSVLLEFVPGVKLDRALYDNHSNNTKIDAILTSSVRALQHLHSKGIAHCDLHQGNILIENDKCTLIDFGYAVENASRTQNFVDYVSLFHCVDEIRNKSSTPLLKIAKNIIYFYVNATLGYIAENKIETAAKILTYGALTVAAIYGISYYTAANIIAQQIAKAVIQEELNSFLQNQLQTTRAHQMLNSLSLYIKLRLCIIKCAVFYSTVNFLYTNKQGFKFSFDLLSNLATGNVAAIGSLNLNNMMELGLLYKPTYALTSLLKTEYDVFFCSQQNLESECENIVYPKSWFAGFNLFKAANNDQELAMGNNNHSNQYNQGKQRFF